ncbi:MAG: type II secretion system F family protein [Capsulimonadales bacterium]|nr:type II secretion system F family protein [Capsulimonadales bacterium]
MAIFRYEVQDKSGKTVRGAMDAPSAQEVEMRLWEKGFRSVRVQSDAGSNVAVSSAVVPAAPSVPYRRNAFSLTTPSPSDSALFFRQMASLLHAGFSISTALDDLGLRTTNRAIRNAARQLAAATAGGASLAQEMGRHPTVFAPHVVGLVAAGEAGGFLEFAFEEAALNAELDAALRQGQWLPRFLFWQAIWSVLLFAPLFPSIDFENLARSIGNYARTVLFLCLPIGVLMHAVAELVGRLRHQPFARDFFDRVSLNVPIMARLAHRRALAAFTRVLRRLLMAGIAAPVAYAGAVEAVPNAALRERLRRGLPVVQSGNGLDAAIQATGMFGGDPIQLLVTGQKTGQFVEMLDRVTTYYQEEAQRATDGAKDAQKRAGILITLLSVGYVTVATVYGLSTIGFRLTENWTN